LRALEIGTVILEMKDGAYEPIGEGMFIKREMIGSFLLSRIGTLTSIRSLRPA
jgi:hypothetical protein